MRSNEYYSLHNKCSTITNKILLLIFWDDIGLSADNNKFYDVLKEYISKYPYKRIGEILLDDIYPLYKDFEPFKKFMFLLYYKMDKNAIYNEHPKDTIKRFNELYTNKDSECMSFINEDGSTNIDELNKSYKLFQIDFE